MSLNRSFPPRILAVSYSTRAAFDAAGAGNGTRERTEAPARGESRRQTATPPSYRDRASSRPYTLPQLVPLYPAHSASNRYETLEQRAGNPQYVEIADDAE
jgi:hypothetical protein